MTRPDLDAIAKRAEDAAAHFYNEAAKDVILMNDVPALVAEVRRLREALEFYADTDSYETPCDCCAAGPLVNLDDGKRARAALKDGET